jgi:hypothetical protein
VTKGTSILRALVYLAIFAALLALSLFERFGYSRLLPDDPRAKVGAVWVLLMLALMLNWITRRKSEPAVAFSRAGVFGIVLLGVVAAVLIVVILNGI